MKIHARHRQPHRESSASTLVFPVDYSFVSGEVRSDCVGLTIGNFGNESQMLFMLKQALLVHLRTKYAPETFGTADVVLF
jgi:hypothetical protein